MRVTAGTYKGKVLEGVNSIRSTKCIVREAIFNIIYSHYNDMLVGGTVLDLYGGTGILSYEALSRGASKAVINDINPIHRNLAMRNALKIGVAERTIFTAQNAMSYKTDFSNIDIVFIDPPYYKDLGGVTVDSIKSNKNPEKEVLIVIELCKEDMLSFNKDRDYPEPRKYGRSYLQVFAI